MFPQVTLDATASFIELHGSELPKVPKRSNSSKINTVCGRLDRIGSNDLRPCEFPENSNPTLLTNGQYAYKAFWTVSVIDTINDGSPDAAIISESEYDSLKPPPSDEI